MRAPEYEPRDWPSLVERARAALASECPECGGPVEETSDGDGVRCATPCELAWCVSDEALVEAWTDQQADYEDERRAEREDA